jgi:hypothetical protein
MGGFTCSHHTHTLDGECSSHSGHDDGSTADGDAVIGHRPPIRATACLSGEKASASPHFVT